VRNWEEKEITHTREETEHVTATTRAGAHSPNHEPTGSQE